MSIRYYFFYGNDFVTAGHKKDSSYGLLDLLFVHHPTRCYPPSVIVSPRADSNHTHSPHGGAHTHTDAFLSLSRFHFSSLTFRSCLGFHYREAARRRREGPPHHLLRWR